MPTSTSAGTIDNLPSTMEYSTDGGTTWIVGTDAAVTGLNPGTNVLIRYAATDDAPASNAATLLINLTQPVPAANTGVVVTVGVLLLIAGLCVYRCKDEDPAA